jgi:hypothetical protein
LQLALSEAAAGAAGLERGRHDVAAREDAEEAVLVSPRTTAQQNSRDTLIVF